MRGAVLVLLLMVERMEHLGESTTQVSPSVFSLLCSTSLFPCFGYAHLASGRLASTLPNAAPIAPRSPWTSLSFTCYVILAATCPISALSSPIMAPLALVVCTCHGTPIEPSRPSPRPRHPCIPPLPLRAPCANCQPN
eukprot:Gb_08680 [translate_table: standard]